MSSSGSYSSSIPMLLWSIACLITALDANER